jgi:ATP-dependent Lon protease
VKKVTNDLNNRIIHNKQPINQLVRAFKNQISGIFGSGKAVCIAGPNKTGKTTLAKSFCKLAGQKLVSFDCGGLSDSAVIDGSSYIYSNCNPGKLYDLILEAGVMNPFILLENVDRISDGGGRNGLPTAVISRWIDYGSNSFFVDNALNVEMDLSAANFILTAENADFIPPELKNKVVVIEIGNYDLQEKIDIAQKFIMPQILTDYDIPKGSIVFERETLVEIINQKAYREGLGELIKIMTDIAIKEGEQSAKNLRITKNYVDEYFADINKKEILRLSDSKHESFRILAKRLYNYDKKEQDMILERAKELQYYITPSDEAYFRQLARYPKGEFTCDCMDFTEIKQKLDSVYLDKKFKDNILNLIVSDIFSGDKKGTVIALIGDPGTGKTYAAQTIAKLLNRKFVTISLANTTKPVIIAGVKNELVGKLADGFMQAGTENPVFLIDEVDKASVEVQNALLNYLDPIQNNKLIDEYLGVEIAVDKALFILTINDYGNVSWPLFDRMEKLFINDYTYLDKIEIAKRGALEKILLERKLGKNSVFISDEVYRFIAKNYAIGSGFRGMEHRLKFIVNMCIREIVEKKLDRYTYQKTITKEMLIDWFDEPTKRDYVRSGVSQVGVANGLAWSAAGGCLLPIEATVSDGNGGFTLTGSLGEVMRESAMVAYTAVKQQLIRDRIDCDLSKKSIHLHSPEGAVRKEGPSAGLTIAIALYSALTNNQVSSDVSISGEINLHGDILPIGGVEEKLIASLDNNIKTVLLSDYNKRDVEKLDNPDVKQLNIVYLNTLSEALKFALTDECDIADKNDRKSGEKLLKHGVGGNRYEC